MRFEPWLSWKYFLGSRHSHIFFLSFISITGVSIAVFSVVVVLGVMAGFSRDLKEKLVSLSYHIEVFTEGFPSQSLLEKVKSVEKSVKGAVIFSRREAGLKKDEFNYLGVRAEGVEFTPWIKNRLAKYLVKEDRSLTSGAFIGEEAANELGVGPGEPIYLYIIDSKNKKRVKEYKFLVKGIFKVGMYDVDRFLVILPLGQSGDFFADKYSVKGIGIVLDSINSAHKAKLKILKQDIPRILAVRTWADNNRALFSAIKLEKTTMFFILSIIILVAAFNIFSTLTVKVVEKTKDIGILKSLGTSPGRIGVIFCLQGVFIGIIGVLTGAGLGVSVLLLIEKYQIIKIPGSVYGLNYLPAAVNFSDILWVGFVGLFLSFVFSLFPAVKAAGIVESEALRYE